MTKHLFGWQIMLAMDSLPMYRRLRLASALLTISPIGGVAMATHIEALERHFERPLLGDHAFLNHGLLGEDMELRVEAISGGRSVASHGRNAAW